MIFDMVFFATSDKNFGSKNILDLRREHGLMVRQQGMGSNVVSHHT